MNTLVILPAKHLLAQLTSQDDAQLVASTVNCFLKGCVRASTMRSEPNWDALFDELAQESYLEVAVHGRMFSIFDQKTGEINTHSWYARFTELLQSLNNYYRLDVMAAIRCVNDHGSITFARYRTHNPQLIIIEIGYNLLLGYSGSR